MLILIEYCSQQLRSCSTWVLLGGSASYYGMYQPAPASHPNRIIAWSPNQIWTLNINWSPAIECSRSGWKARTGRLYSQRSICLSNRRQSKMLNENQLHYHCWPLEQIPGTRTIPKFRPGWQLWCLMYTRYEFTMWSTNIVLVTTLMTK